jgi:hypothetical protein
MHVLNEVKFLTFTGSIITCHSRYIYCFPQPVHYASEYSLQSAGEARTGPVGYQTDTSHIRAEERGCDTTDRCSPTIQLF